MPADDYPKDRRGEPRSDIQGSSDPGGRRSGSNAASAFTDTLADPLRRTLGRLGDAAGPTRTFDELDLSEASVSITRRRLSLLAVSTVAVVLVVALTLAFIGPEAAQERIVTDEGLTASLRATADVASIPVSSDAPRATPNSRSDTPPIVVEPGQTVAEIRELVVSMSPITAEAFDASLETRGPEIADELNFGGLVTFEGLLGAGSYEVGGTADELVAAMLRRFVQTAVDAGLDTIGPSLGLTPYQAVIVASLVEAETTVDAERARIARVIYNRLEAGEPLGIDSALEYGLGRPVETRADLEIDSPYNLRRYHGLPPTPIGTPSLASLLAAASPEPGDWLFYVRTDESGPGSHRFAETVEEFSEGLDLCRDRNLGCEAAPPPLEDSNPTDGSIPPPNRGVLDLRALEPGEQVTQGSLIDWLGTYVWTEQGDGSPIEHRLVLESVEDTRSAQGWLFQEGDGVNVREAIRIDLHDGYLIVVAHIAGGDASPYDDFTPVFALSGDPGSPQTTLLGLIRRNTTLPAANVELFVPQSN